MQIFINILTLFATGFSLATGAIFAVVIFEYIRNRVIKWKVRREIRNER
ncbi:hypothetical protein [Lonepinella koalarum]|uniref:Uncharacterized protein n=1 Tax=Lonepinella koalarum TaxID=53417 RepID=A0A4V2PT32_9PAST|nr:hypothetical protein [Lonepinella koalarum]TCK64931.1 hypothetical protein EV692_2416 [Lonepinella koalarum]